MRCHAKSREPQLPISKQYTQFILMTDESGSLEPNHRREVCTCLDLEIEIGDAESTFK